MERSDISCSSEFIPLFLAGEKIYHYFYKTIGKQDNLVLTKGRD